MSPMLYLLWSRRVMLCANCCVSLPCIRSVCIDVHGEELEEFRICCYAVLAKPVYGALGVRGR